jgi:hypothetical protein
MIAALTFGRYLRDARERQGWSREQLSQDAHIPLADVEALEAGLLDALPKGMYRRAEARAYAELVGLDPQLVLAELQLALDAARTTVPAVAEHHVVRSAPPVVRAASPQPTPSVALVPVTASERPAPLTKASSDPRNRWRVGVALIIGAAALLWDQAGAPTLDREMAIPAAPTEAAKLLADAVRIAEPRPAPALNRTLFAPTARSRDGRLDGGVLVVQSTPRGARVTVNGVGWGVTPVAIRYLPLGAVRVRIAKERHVSQERVVQLSTEQPSTTLRVTLPQVASARVASSPPTSGSMLVVTTTPEGARVTVNGVGWGMTPVTIRHLPPGTQRVRVVRERYLSEERVVQVSDGQPRRVIIPMRPVS